MALEGWDGRSIEQGAAWLYAARARNGLTSSWSIAELRLTEADYEKLVAWGRAADGAAIVRRLESTSSVDLPAPAEERSLPLTVTAGLLLLAFGAESVVRHGSTYEVWPAFRESLGESLRASLFTPSGQPTPALKGALRETAERLDMRRATGEGRENWWFRLLLLQGGFPLFDAERLPAWLVHPASFLMSALQSDATFARAWNALRRLGQGGTRDEAHRALRTCPFFRPAHHDTFLDEASRPRPRAKEVPFEHAAEGTFSVMWRLDWPAHAAQPVVVAAPRFAAGDEFSDRVRVSEPGGQSIRFRRVGENSLEPFTGDELRFSLAESFEITARDLPPADHEELACWALFEGDEAAAAFDVDGERCDLDARGVRYVAAREPVSLHGEGRIASIEHARVAVAELGPDARLHGVDGAQLWPGDAAVQAPSDAELGLAIDEVEVGDELGAVELRIVHSPSATVHAARIGGSSLSIGARADDGRSTRLQGRVAPSDATPELRLTVVLHFESRRVQRTLPFRAFTAASVDGVWLSEESVLSVDRLRAGALRVALGPELQGADAQLVASARREKVAVPEGKRAGGVRFDALGYGEALRLCAREPWLDERPRVLASRVEDRGEVVGLEHREGVLQLRLRFDAELDANHWMLVWPERGRPFAVRPASGSARTWTARLEEPPRAVAACYGGAVLGASWVEGWASELDGEELDARTLVRLVRLLRLPVLAAPCSEQVIAALRAGAVADAFDECVQREARLVVGAGDNRRELVSSASDVDRWPHVAREVLLALRFNEAAQLTAFKNLLRERHPTPTLQTGTPVSDEHRAQLQAADNALVAALLAGGVAPPPDAVRLTKEQGFERSRLSLRLERAIRDLSVRALEGRTAAQKRKRLDDEKDRLLAALRASKKDCEAWRARVEQWLATKEPPSLELRAALVDPRFHKAIQLELIDARASGTQPTR